MLFVVSSFANNMVKYINKSEFKNKVLDSKEIVLVDFMYEWCGACQRQLPILKSLANKTEVKIYKVNLDNNSELGKAYGVEATPTIIIFKHGTQIKKMVGIQNEKQLLSSLKKSKFIFK